MGKKRSHESGGASLHAPSKKRRNSASSTDYSLLSKPASSHLSPSLSHISQNQDDTENHEAYSNPQQVSKSTYPHVRNPLRPGDTLQSKYCNANGNYTGQSKALNFSVPQHFSSDASTSNHRFSKPAQVSLNFPPYNGRLSNLPPLPRIPDKALESAAFTHPGSLSCDTASKVNISYDRLEFLGDAYIELMATRVLFPRFPNLTAGRLSQQREMLVKNETLAEYALNYGFDEKAKLPSTLSTSGKDSRKLWIKIMGDIFEAFVAAVIISDPEQGFQTAEAWLAALWESKLGSQKSEDTEIVDPKAKQHLAAKIMGKGIRVDYRDEAPPEEIRREGKQIFRIGVFLTGWGWTDQHLGSGKGLSKQEAGQRAATAASMNPLTAQVASVKRDFDEQVARERTMQHEAEKEKDVEVGSHG